MAPPERSEGFPIKFARAGAETCTDLGNALPDDRWGLSLPQPAGPVRMDSRVNSTASQGRMGVLLLNLGTPAAPTVPAVRRFLAEFLTDRRVIHLPTPLRWLVVHAGILPFRPRRSARAYASIWTERGSPLLMHGRDLRDELSGRLGSSHAVALGMRYGSPSIAEALQELQAAEVDGIAVVPLFPQHDASSSGSAVERALESARSVEAPVVRTVGPFFAHPSYIAALSEVARPHLERFGPDHVLMSYHGLPVGHVRKADATGSWCLRTEGCCDSIGPSSRECYRAQCFATSRALAAALSLSPEEYTVSFQSRLGPVPWIEPYTDRSLGVLARSGVRRLAVICPSFVADCLETLEEIGIRGRSQWEEAGGEELLLVPCLNSHPSWVDAMLDLLGVA